MVADNLHIPAVGTTRDSGVDEAIPQGASTGPTIRSRRELRGGPTGIPFSCTA